MGNFRVLICVLPKKAVLDPQGKAIESALHSLGFQEVMDVRMGRFLGFVFPADDYVSARRRAEDIAVKYINPTMESYAIAEVEPT